MKCFTLTLPETNAALEVYLRDSFYEFVDHTLRPCMIICPGGGYQFLSDCESEPAAMAFVRAGYQTVILRYTTRPTREAPCLNNLPLCQCAEAVRYIRSHAKEWGIHPQKISVCGFSAGGHLAGSLGVFYADKTRILNTSDISCRPDAMVLCYPPVSSQIQDPDCGGTFPALAGTEQAMQDAWSLDAHVTPDTVPAFLWHTAEDACVSVEHSMRMAKALKEHHVPFELHIYTHGPHGMSVATGETGCSKELPAATWLSLSLSWLNEQNVGTGYQVPVSVL